MTSANTDPLVPKGRTYKRAKPCAKISLTNNQKVQHGVISNSYCLLCCAFKLEIHMEINGSILARAVV